MDTTTSRSRDTAADHRPMVHRMPMLTDPGAEVGISIDVAKLLVTKMLLTASSGGGKSWAIRRILEQTFGHAQHIVFDWDGEFHTLREHFDYSLIGEGGEAPAVIGPNDHDDKLDPRETHPGMLMMRLLEMGTSAIIDLSDLRGQRDLYVQRAVQSMMLAPRHLWHGVEVVIDEIHKLAPERGAGDARSLGAIKDLATDGRKRGFALIGATQRVAELSKTVVAELHNRLVGMTTMDLDIDRARRVIGMKSTMADQALKGLSPGEFYVVGPALSKTVVRATIGSVITTHPEPGAAPLPPTPPRAEVRKLLGAFKDIHKEAVEQAETIETLRARVRELEASRKSGGGETTAKPDDAAIAGYTAKITQLNTERRELEFQLDSQRRLLAAIKLQCSPALDAITRIADIAVAFTPPTGDPTIATAPPPNIPPPTHKRRQHTPTSPPPKPSTKADDQAPRASTNGRDLKLTIRTVLAQRGALPRRKVLIYGRYKRSGATDKAFAELVESGHIKTTDSGIVEITGHGRQGLVVPPLDPVVHDMPEIQRRLLAVLEHYGESTKQEALLFAMYARSGATDAAFTELAANDWISSASGRVAITTDGSDALGPHEPPPMGAAFRARIRETLNKPQLAFFDYLCGIGKATTKVAVLEATNYKRSGATDDAFAHLVRRHYANKGRGKGEVLVNEDLFRHG